MVSAINQELYENLKSLTIAVSNLLIESRKLVTREIGLLLLDYRKEIAELPEAKASAETMESAAAIRREFASRISDDVGTPVEKPGIGMICRVYLHPFLSQYFRRLDNIRFDQDVFDSSYIRFQEYLYSDSLRYTVLSPLAGFKSDVDAIKLEKDLKIRRMSQDEINGLWKPRDAFLPGIIDHMDAFAFKYTLEAPLSQPKKGKISVKVDMKPPSLNDRFEGVITALRLFKSGTVDFFFTQQTPVLWDPVGGISYSFKKKGDYLGLNYSLEKDEVDRFTEFWTELGNTIVNEDFHNHNYLRIALRRFNQGLEERDPENRFVDLFVAFEALYLPETLELSYRLALRVATLLGESPKEKNEIFNIMRDAYTLRSQIVHGKHPKIRKKLVDLKDYGPTLEDYLRRSTVKFLRMIKNYKDHEKILDSIDQRILG